MHPSFVLQLTCSEIEYDLYSSPDKSKAIFRDPSKVKECLISLIISVFREYKVIVCPSLAKYLRSLGTEFAVSELNPVHSCLDFPISSTQDIPYDLADQEHKFEALFLPSPQSGGRSCKFPSENDTHDESLFQSCGQSLSLAAVGFEPTISENYEETSLYRGENMFTKFEKIDKYPSYVDEAFVMYPTVEVSSSDDNFSLSNTRSNKRNYGEYIKTVPASCTEQENTMSDLSYSSFNMYSSPVSSLLVNNSSLKTETIHNNHVSMNLNSDFKVLSSVLSPQKGVSASLPPLANVVITKEDLANIDFVGQVDKKYLIAMAGQNLLCFDQHAVDERVRLENFPVFVAPGDLDDTAADASSVVSTDYALLLSDEERYAAKHGCHEAIERWGFRLRIENHRACLLQVPLVLGEPLTVNDFLEFLRLLMYQMDGHMSAFLRPPAVSRIFASKACRSAAKFGDELERSTAVMLLKSLSAAHFPFQCAHGRVSVVPLVLLSPQVDISANKSKRQWNYSKLLPYSQSQVAVRTISTDESLS